MRPHPILILLSDAKPFGGAEHSVADLVRRLDRSLFSVRVVVPRESSSVERFRAAEVPVHVMPLTRARDLVRFPRFLALLDEHRIELVNSHGVRGGFYAALAQRMRGVKVVVCERNLQPWRAQVGPRMLDRFVARNNDVRVGVSQTIVDDMVAANVIARERTRMIPGGVDVARFAAAAARRDHARTQFGLEADRLVVVAAGRLHPMKGFIDLVNAVPRVVERVPQALVLVAGEGEERALLEKRIAELKVGHAIRLIGYVRDMSQLLGAADVFVLPSVGIPGKQQEGTPLSIQEAGATGLPVVTTRVSGNAEIIRDGFNGRIVEDQNPGQLADAIVDVLEDRERRKMGENAQRVVRERYSLEHVVAAYTEMFLDLLEAGQRRR
jgi:glycosyltransferase involved in cell wall biosynthesis